MVNYICQSLQQRNNDISIVGSAALIVFYIRVMIISIPTIGLQTDIGIPGILAKTFQGIIIAIAFILNSINDNSTEQVEKYQSTYQRKKT